VARLPERARMTALPGRRDPVVLGGRLEDTRVMRSHDDSEAGVERSRPDAGRAQRRHEPATELAVAQGDGRHLTPSAVLQLQRDAGNASVVSLLQRDLDEEGAEEGGSRSPVLDVVGSGGGQALDAGIRSEMESAFGHDFGSVRVHTGARAADSARSVQAKAYTVGDDIVFGSGVSPASSEGRHTLAHELTHVVQQRSGPVDGTPAAGGISVSDPSDRFERAAEATADSVVAGSGAGGEVGGGSAVQRQAEDELEELDEDE